MSPQNTAMDMGEDDFVDELKPGTELMHGQYTIEAFLAAGGFGITYLARDSLNRRVVIKECFPGNFCRRQNTSVAPRSRAHQAELRSIVRLFSQEAQSLARANHPNIVGVHQIFEENNTAYMALDYVQGRDLLEILEEDHASLTPEKIEGYLLKVLDAIKHIHDQGLLHRDISPDNIIIDEKGEPILIDFGAARETTNAKVTRMLSALRVVKDGYSPQEFYIAGSEQSPSCDLYSLAASFYHIITQELPPDSQLRLSSRAANDGDPYVSLGQKTKAYSPSFISGLDKAMAILPRDRMQSADAWIAHLKGQKIAAPAPENAAPKAAQPATATEKKSFAPMLLGSTALVAAAGAGLFMMTASETDAPTGAAPSTDVVAVATPEPAPDAPLMDEAQVALPAPVVPEAAPDTAPLLATPAPADPAPQLAAPLPADIAPVGEVAAPVIDLAEIDIDMLEPVMPAAETMEDFVVEAAAVSLPDALANPTPRPLRIAELALIDALGAAPTVSVAPPAPLLRTPAPAPEVDVVADAERATPEAESLGVDFFVSMAKSQPALQSVLSGPMETVAPEPTTTAAAATPSDVDAAPVFIARFVPSMPFTLSRSQPGRIETVAPNAPSWISEDTQIVSVNGQSVETNDDVEAAFRAALPETDTGTFEVSLGIGSGLTGVVFERRLTVGREKHTLLLNGLTFVSRKDAAGWATRVEAAPAASNFKVGDTLISYVPTWQELDGPDSLETILQEELAGGQSNFNFAVNRDGEIWIEAFTLASSEN